jgi:hypothetical protein
MLHVMLYKLKSFVSAIYWTFQNELIVDLEEQLPSKLLKPLVIVDLDHGSDHDICGSTLDGGVNACS